MVQLTAEVAYLHQAYALCLTLRSGLAAAVVRCMSIAYSCGTLHSHYPQLWQAA